MYSNKYYFCSINTSPHELTKEIGAYLKQLRKLKGVTQAELAEQIGIKTGTYVQFETGRTNMTLATINKIADALGYETDVSFRLKI